jgi:hypothetical protein
VAEVDRNRLMLVLALLGALNAVARPVAASIQDAGWAAAAGITFGVNPAVWVALIIALAGLGSSLQTPLMRRDIVLTAIVLLGLTVPSATASWLVLAAFSAVLMLDHRLAAPQHTGAAILMVTALRDPLVSTATHLFNEPLLALDAALAAMALAPFAEGVHADGNLVLGPDGARLVVLTSCSSLANLSYALLFWFAVSRALLPRLNRRAWTAGAALALLLIAQNVARLAMMAASDAGYEIIHGASGRLLFEALMLLVVTGLTLLGVRDVHTKRHRDRASAAARPA